MRAVVKKWGNSAAVRIPASIMSATSLVLDQAVEIREEDGRVVIEPIASEVYDLDTLLDAMQPETFHEDVDFGLAKGEEVW